MSYYFGTLLIIFCSFLGCAAAGDGTHYFIMENIYVCVCVYNSLRLARSCKNSTHFCPIPVYPSPSLLQCYILQNHNILSNQEIDIGIILLIQIQTSFKFHQFFLTFILLEGGCSFKKFYHIYRFV